MRRVTAIGVALAALVTLGAARCQATGRSAGCTEACSQDDDTVTVECIFQPPPPGKDTEVHVTWTVAGAVQHDERVALSRRPGGVYHAWFHDWRKNGYPRISITCDETEHYGLSCAIRWYEPGRGITTVDFVNRGVQAPPGNATCSSDAWLNQRLNRGD